MSRRRGIRRLVAGLAVLSCAAVATRGADPEVSRLKLLSLEELANLEVTTSTKLPEALRRSAAAVFVLTREDILRSGAANLPEALRLVPGVQVARIDANKYAVGIRGFTSRISRSILVLVDGRSVYTPLFAGTYWEDQDLLLEDVERIEVIRGPGATIWGANAFNGVINIITRSARDTHGLLATASTRTFERGSAGVSWGATAGAAFDYRVYGKFSSRGPQKHLDGSDFDDSRRVQLGFRTDWTLANDDVLSLQGEWRDADAGARLAVSRYDPPERVAVFGDIEMTGGHLLGRWSRLFAGGSDLQVLAYFDRTDRRDLNFAETRNTFDVDVLHHLRGERHNFSWGLGARVSRGDTDRVVPTVEFVPESETDRIVTAFVQDEIALRPDRLFLTLGSKLLHNSYTGLEVQPTARLLWAPSASASYWAALTRAVRTPSRIDRQLLYTSLASPTDPPIYVRLVGNEAFESESLDGFEAGVRLQFADDLYVSLSAFHNDYQDLLGIEPGDLFAETGPPDRLILPVLFSNNVRGRTRGFEVVPTWNPAPGWRLRGAYSSLHMDLEAIPGSADTRTPDQVEGTSPRHQLVVQSLWDLRPGLGFDLTYRYVDELPDPGIRAYDTLDAGLLWEPRQGLEVAVFARNLDGDHVEFASEGNLPDVLIRRGVYGRLTWRR